ncbi:MAG TPA: Crp/Fnr family transcriptional regulator [Rhizomicrobium sp.]|jgi:CRP-like cAMP-binding protein
MGIRVNGQPKLIAAALRGIRLFADWPDTALQPLHDTAQLWRYKKGETVVERGDPATGVWGVVTGSATSGRNAANGTYYLQGVQWPGEVFGLTAAIDGFTSPFSHGTRTDALLVLIPRAAFLEALYADPAHLRSLLAFISTRTRVEYEAGYTHIAEPLSCSLAKLLAFLPRRSLVISDSQPGSPGWIDPAPVDLTQDELAAMMGVARQTVNRAMMSFLQNNIVARDGEAIRVVNFKKLLAIMEEIEPLPEEWRIEILSWDERARRERKNASPAQPGLPAQA